MTFVMAGPLFSFLFVKCLFGHCHFLSLNFVMFIVEAPLVLSGLLLQENTPNHETQPDFASIYTHSHAKATGMPFA